MWPLFVLIILIVLYPVVRWIADKDIENTNKKVEDHYKMMEAKRKAECEELLNEAERENNNNAN